TSVADFGKRWCRQITLWAIGERPVIDGAPNHDLFRPPARRSACKPCQAVVEHDDVALHRAGAEGNLTAVWPHLGADGLARKDGGREAYLQALKARGIAAAAGLNDGASRYAKGAQAVQDRHSEATPGGGGGVGSQPVAVAREAVDQRRIGVGLDVEVAQRLAVGKLVRRGLWSTLAPESAIAAQHCRRGHGGDSLARLLVEEGALSIQEGALLLALVKKV